MKNIFKFGGIIMEQIRETNKKSFKEKVVENKGKILIGTFAIGMGALTYTIFKTKMDVRKNNETIELVRDVVKEGALKEAIATINRKINYRIEKIDQISLTGLNEEKILAKNKYEEELKELMKKLESFTKEYNSISIQ